MVTNPKWLDWALVAALLLAGISGLARLQRERHQQHEALGEMTEMLQRAEEATRKYLEETGRPDPRVGCPRCP